MRGKEMIAIILAGGQGSRLGILTNDLAKPAVPFGGKYRIIDFAMSNCVNSGIDTVGVLTQYQPLDLNQHIGIGIPWDLDRNNGGVTMLSPFVKGDQGEWYQGTANAVCQNIDYINKYNPEYVLILSGDHIYKMDYSAMLQVHKKNKSDATIAVLEVTMEEASRFGIMNTTEDDFVYEFEEKPENPKNNLASMGIYIFDWQRLKEILIEDGKVHSDSDFGKHIIPNMLSKGLKLKAYRFNDYWKDVGTLESYWESNMELIKTLPDFNLYQKFWHIYTNSEHQLPQYTSETANVNTSLISEGCEIYGEVFNSILGPSVYVAENAKIIDSIVMKDTVIGEGAVIEKTILGERTFVGKNAKIGLGENIPNKNWPNIYMTGIPVIGSDTTIPEDVEIGKNCVVNGKTNINDYENGMLLSGDSIIKV